MSWNIASLLTMRLHVDDGKLAAISRRAASHTANIALLLIWIFLTTVASGDDTEDANVDAGCWSTCGDERVWKSSKRLSQALQSEKNCFSSIENGVLSSVKNDGVSSTNPSTVYGGLFFNGRQQGIRLARGDAIVIVYCVPPPARYHSFTASALTRQTPLWPAHASYSDAVNNLVMNTTAEQQQQPWCQRAVMVVTADGDALEAVRRSLPQAGLSDAELNLILVAESAGAIERDSVLVVSRTSIPDLSSGEYQKRNFPVFIARRGGRFAAARKPLPDNFLGGPRTPSSGITESHLEAQQAVLVKAVERRLADDGGFSLTGESGWSPVSIDRQRCLSDRGYRPFSTGALTGFRIPGCYAEVSDASYFIGDQTFAATDDLMVVVVGVNHRRTRKAAFHNIVVYKQPTTKTAVAALQLDVLAGTDDRQFENSASQWLGEASVDSPEDLYVHIFVGRQELCPNFVKWKSCTVIAPQSNGGKVLLIERAYMDPETRTRPNGGELIAPRVLSFSKNKYQIA